MNRYLFFSSLFCVLASCATPLPKQELFIIGTVHFPSQNINADSIAKVLFQVQPDCILLELDSSFFDKNFAFNRPLEENENQAALKYLEQRHKTLLRPIEFEGRNQYRKENGLFSDASPVFRQINDLNRAKVFSPKEQFIWDKFVEHWTAGEALGTKDLRTINSLEADAVIDSSKLYQYVHLQEIIKAQDGFDAKMLDAKGDSISMENYFKQWAQFEYIDRNNAMVNNILHTMKNLPLQKRFVVMVGFHHRFYLKKELGKRVVNFELKAFYE